MQIKADSVNEYLELVPDERKGAIRRLRDVILFNIPDGFIETIQYSMLSYVVPHSLYPAGYHCKPSDALPFISIGSQKNFIALYHMGVYADEKLLNWFKTAYPNHSTRKLDMGKSCIRFKNVDHIPYKLIGELASKMSVAEWIKLYELAIKR
ncbi:MAG: DUF1801 domain-containing protein [Balneolales bacterium]